MREAIPVKWIEDYLKRIKHLENDYFCDDGKGASLDSIFKQEVERMMDEYDLEERVAERDGKEYVICEKKIEVVERMPNGYTLTRESYVPLRENNG